MRHAGVLCVLMSLLLGCSGTPMGGGSKTGSSMTAIADQMEVARAQLDTTMQDLEVLTSMTEGDPAPSYKVFADSVKALDNRAKQVRKTSERIASKSEAYFEAWEEELATINNEDIKSQSQARRDAVREGIGRVRTRFDELADLYTPLMADLQDLVAVLKTDLTLDGVKAVSRPANKAQSSAQKVMNKAEELEADFRELGIALGG